MDTVKGSLITINVETEFILTMEMRNKKVKGYITMVNAQAVLIDSKVGMMSQKVGFGLNERTMLNLKPEKPCTIGFERIFNSYIGKFSS